MYPKVPIDKIWQVIPELRYSMCYVDIETLGLDQDLHQIIAVSVYDGMDVKTYIQGISSTSSLRNVIRLIESKEAIVTWRGTSFDIPFLVSQCKLRMSHIHFDLSYLCPRVGLKTHLKQVESELQITRGGLTLIDGSHIGKLWELWLETKDVGYIKILEAYNSLDATNLEPLLCEYYNRMTDLHENGYHISYVDYPKVNVDKKLIREIIK